MGRQESEFFCLTEDSVSLKDSLEALNESSHGTLEQVAEKVKDLTRMPKSRTIIIFNEEDYVICWNGATPPVHVMPLSAVERANFLKSLTEKMRL